MNNSQNKKIEKESRHNRRTIKTTDEMTMMIPDKLARQFSFFC